jgi:hypothetical protein
MASSDENIWTAAGDGHLDAVRSFISGGVAVNAQDEFGYSAMYGGKRPINVSNTIPTH